MQTRPTLHLFENRAAEEKKRLEVLASELSPGPTRDEIMEKIGQLDAAAKIDKWASSPGLKAMQLRRRAQTH
jgi:hypothetical protein